MVAVKEFAWEEVSSPDFGSRAAWREAVADIADKARAKLPECNGRILLANPLQSSKRTFSWGSFLSFFACKEGMWDTQIAALLSSPTVSARILLANPKTSFHCPNLKFYMEAVIINNNACIAGVCPLPEVCQEAFF